jgi:Kef-type K+ transport system membrane component KefB
VADPVARLGLSIAVILVVAKLGGDLASRARQPAVLGELLGGLLLGSIPLPLFAHLRTDPDVDLLARLGVLVLLFEVGLEATVRDVARVGAAAAAVALLGTVGTLGAGWGAATLVQPHASVPLHLFLAASLTATSIGIGARVLQDLGASRTREAHTILGASVIDDVLGLVVLAIASGAVKQSGAGTVSPWSVVVLLLKTFGFLLGAIVLGVKASPALFRLTARLRGGGALVATGLSLCFVLAWAADLVGLSPIVGAFTAGLILEESHSARFVERGEPSLSERMEPISSWLVPIFFVLVGMRADLRAMADGGSLLLVGALLVAAIVGKLACALGAPRGTDRLAIALGMMPRGEVSLVFANLGLSLHLLDLRLYAAIVTVVIATTLVTPPTLRARLSRRRVDPT